MAQQIMQMQATIDALNTTVRDLAAEVVQLRTVATQAHQQIGLLTQKSTDAWAEQTKLINGLDVDLKDLETKVGNGGGGEKKQYWNLDTKGQVAEYSGDPKVWRGWAKKVMAFCNGRQPGFRKALLWAAQQQVPIDDASLTATNWEHIKEANQKLYDLLITVTTDKALQKVETTVGDDPGFECWRRLARQNDPTSRFTKIDRLNNITQTTESTSMRDLLNKIEAWEQRWTKYEMDNNETLSQDLKLGALMKMLPAKEREVVRLKYVENESALSYDVLRRQVEYWLESVTASNGPAPMDLSTLQENIAAGTLNVEQLEAALDILRKGGGPRGKGGNRGTPSGSTKGASRGNRSDT